MDMADERKKVCVHLGTNTRIAHFESASASSDLSEVSKAIKSTFGLDQFAKLTVQAQNDSDWKEKWFDIVNGEEIPNKSELKVVVDTQVCQL